MIQVDAVAIDGLLDEIRRYLDVLDVFRREGCEPHWHDTLRQEEVNR